MRRGGRCGCSCVVVLSRSCVHVHLCVQNEMERESTSLSPLCVKQLRNFLLDGLEPLVVLQGVKWYTREKKGERLHTTTYYLIRLLRVIRVIRVIIIYSK